VGIGGEQNQSSFGIDLSSVCTHVGAGAGGSVGGLVVGCGHSGIVIGKLTGCTTGVSAIIWHETGETPKTKLNGVAVHLLPTVASRLVEEGEGGEGGLVHVCGGDHLGAGLLGLLLLCLLLTLLLQNLLLGLLLLEKK